MQKKILSLMFCVALSIMDPLLAMEQNEDKEIVYMCPVRMTGNKPQTLTGEIEVSYKVMCSLVSQSPEFLKEMDLQSQHHGLRGGGLQSVTQDIVCQGFECIITIPPGIMNNFLKNSPQFWWQLRLDHFWYDVDASTAICPIEKFLENRYYSICASTLFEDAARYNVKNLVFLSFMKEEKPSYWYPSPPLDKRKGTDQSYSFSLDQGKRCFELFVNGDHLDKITELKNNPEDTTKFVTDKKDIGTCYRTGGVNAFFIRQLK